MDADPIELRAEGGSFLRMSEFEFFRDGSGGRCNVEVQSGEIFFRTPFLFDLDPFRNFVISTCSIAENLTGLAWFGLEYEPSRVTITGTDRGHIKVSGDLYIGQEQQVVFAFDSDQSFMPPFIGSLKELLDTVANV